MTDCNADRSCQNIIILELGTYPSIPGLSEDGLHSVLELWMIILLWHTKVTREIMGTYQYSINTQLWC